MKTKLAFHLVAAFAVLAVSQPVMAASKKPAQRRETQTLVAALQAVSPDALGGRLGLNIATANAPKSKVAAPTQQVVKSSARSSDQLDYLSWKSAKKS